MARVVWKNGEVPSDVITIVETAERSSSLEIALRRAGWDVLLGVWVRNSGAVFGAGTIDMVARKGAEVVAMQFERPRSKHDAGCRKLLAYRVATGVAVVVFSHSRTLTRPPRGI